MPTEPIKEVCPETAGDAKVMEILGRLSEGVQECVRFGTHVAKWCMDNPVWKDERSLPVLLSFRHALELLESISVLIRYGLADPCKILLRCFFETCLYIEFLLGDSTGQRAMSFLVCHAKRKIKSYLQMMPDSPERKEFMAALKKDSINIHMNNVVIDGIPQRIQNLEQLLAKPEYREVVEEYEHVRKNDRRRPEWYHLFEGPQNIEQLSDQLGHSGKYEILYRLWSRATHGLDLINGNISPGPNGLVNFVQIRNPEFAQDATSLAISFAHSLFEVMVKFNRPDYNAKVVKWYVREIRKLQMQLTSDEIIKVRR